jgi:hypothetical protein
MLSERSGSIPGDRRGPGIIHHRASCLLAALLVGAWAIEAHSSILLFDQTREDGVVVPTGDGGDVPAGYGDRVAGAVQAVPGGAFTYGEAGEGFTPNVVVDFFSIAPGGANDVTLFTESYGDLTNVLFGNQSSNTLNVRLTAEGSFSVLLHGFDLAGWPDRDYRISAVRVLDGSATLFSQAEVLVEGDFAGSRHTSFSFATPLSGSELLIEIDYSNIPGSQQDNIGIDNIRFGQNPPAVVPLPATAVLCISALTVLASRARRPRRSRATADVVVWHSGERRSRAGRAPPGSRLGPTPPARPRPLRFLLAARSARRRECEQSGAPGWPCGSPGRDGVR